MKRLATLALAAFALPAAADLQVYNVSGQLLLPETSQFACVNPGAPGVSFEYFDVRLPPSAQPVLSSDGTLVVIGDCDVGGSFPRVILIGNCPDESGNIQFAYGGPTIPAGTLYDIGGNLNPTITGPYPFSPGDEVGPNASWTTYSAVSTGAGPFWDRPPQFDITDQEHRTDVDWVRDGIIIGLEITEPDGVHYGWIEIERLPGYNSQQVSLCVEDYRVVRYAYETEPGVPALVTSDCIADTNGDGTLSPADFSAWIAAFNANAPECDQNGDTLCTPADFTAWIANYNAGC